MGLWTRRGKRKHQGRYYFVSVREHRTLDVVVGLIEHNMHRLLPSVGIGISGLSQMCTDKLAKVYKPETFRLGSFSVQGTHLAVYLGVFYARSFEKLGVALRCCGVVPQRFLLVRIPDLLGGSSWDYM